jgi:hypothetical protein
VDFLGVLALILLTLVGYSVGRVVVNLKVKVVPHLADLILVVILWVGALWTRQPLGKGWAIIIWSLVGGIAGVLASLFLRGGQAVENPSPQTTNFLKRAWESWLVFIRRMGDFQSRMLLGFFYFVIVLPFGLFVRLTSDPLQLRKGSRNSCWHVMPASQTELDEARKQY